MKNPYAPIRAEIKGVVQESPTIKSFALAPDEAIPFKTGQFVELTVPGVGEGPFTPSSSPYTTDKMDVTVMKVGAVTAALHNMKPGEMVGMRGPYGVGYPLEDLKEREVLICGGGVGLAPLRSLLLTLHHYIADYKRVILRYGARTPSDLIYKRQITEWEKDEKLDVMVTVDHGDDSWKGRVGLVTTIYEGAAREPESAVAVVCGPPVMMKFSIFKLLDIGFNPGRIYLSMEKNMSCGLGLCGHCRLGNYYVCKEGPVFTYEQVKDIRGIWD